MPYGGAVAESTGASLLLPTGVWGTDHVAANLAPNLSVPTGLLNSPSTHPTLNVVASSDDTDVTLVPNHAVIGGGSVPAAAPGHPLTVSLQRGQHLQITQVEELTGSFIKATKPVGLMGGNQCMFVPATVYACDHGEQMIPGIHALGSEYVGVMHRPRLTEPAMWRLVGAVDGTSLSWSHDVGGPSALGAGEVVELVTDIPFVVSSQDEDHPFLLLSYMLSSHFSPELQGRGDPDGVLVVPAKQYLSSYVFFTDPTYPETNLVLVRSKLGGAFHDVVLDCAGVVGGWQPVGEYQWARIDLTVRFESVAGCSTGRREIHSHAPFGVTVWGWAETGFYGDAYSNGYVSYGYPGGMNVKTINRVELPLPR
jgi:hypothetical protein